MEILYQREKRNLQYAKKVAQYVLHIGKLL